MPDVMANRRNSPRYSLILVASVRETGYDTHMSARTSDISRTGCYIDTLTPLAKGAGVHVTLTRSEETFEATGKVVYVSPGLGMGIQFDDPVDPLQLVVLNRWLEKANPLR